MFCFSKFCCICLTSYKHALQRNLNDINSRSKDNIKLLDKIICCLPEVILNKIPDAKICCGCREQILRAYNIISKGRKSFKILSGYAQKLSNNNFKKNGSILCVDLNEKNKKQKLLSNTETNEIYDDLRLLMPNIIVESVQHFEKPENSTINSENNDNTSIVDLKYFNNQFNYNEEYNTNEVYIQDVKLESSIKTEPSETYEEAQLFLPINEISIKDEVYSPVDIKIFKSLPEDDKYNNDTLSSTGASDIFSDDTLPLTEPVEDNTCLEELNTIELNTSEEVSNNIIHEKSNNIEDESSNINKEINTSQESEKRKKPSQLPCPLCNNCFSNNAMARHLANQHNKGRFNCTVCDMSFKTEFVLKNHFAIHVDNPITGNLRY